MIRRLQSGVAAKQCWRYFHSSGHTARPRVYRYAVDVHGQLFLYDTKPKNLTSCFKNPEPRKFLNFFFSRVRPNDEDADDGRAVRLSEEWTEELDFTAEQAMALGRGQGYHWLSPCQGEYNLVRADDSPIVFRELNDEGQLIWAGNLTWTFQPDQLKVDVDTGYVFHPSPEPPLASQRKRAAQGAAYHPYGAYSLLSSALVLQRLAAGLELDPNRFGEGLGGSISYNGSRYDLGILSEQDVARQRRYQAGPSE